MSKAIRIVAKVSWKNLGLGMSNIIKVSLSKYLLSFLPKSSFYFLFFTLLCTSLSLFPPCFFLFFKSPIISSTLLYSGFPFPTKGINKPNYLLTVPSLVQLKLASLGLGLFSKGTQHEAN